MRKKIIKYSIIIDFKIFLMIFLFRKKNHYNPFLIDYNQIFLKIMETDNKKPL